jgi:hypothetical protein
MEKTGLRDDIFPQSVDRRIGEVKAEREEYSFPPF